MLLKTHIPSSYITYLMALEQREELSNDEKMRLRNYKNGLNGERKFVQLLNECGGFILWDIQLNISGFAQYDVIVVGGQTVFIFDVKNFSGTYRYNDGVFISQNGICIKDVRPQLKRAHYMMKDFLRQSRFNHQVISKIIFINDSFILRGFDGDQCIVFPQQLEAVVKHMNHVKGTDDDRQLVDYLCGNHINDYSGDTIRYRTLSTLKPGMRCPHCQQLIGNVEYKKKYIFCRCGAKNKRADIILSSLKELYLLKNNHFSKQEALWWTGEADSSVKRVLRQAAAAHGIGKAARYSFED